MGTSCILLADGRRIGAEKLIGNGTDGFIISEGCHVLKIPKLFGRLQPDGSIEPDSNNDLHRGDLEAEKKVYERLRKMPGVAECIECTSNGILLKYYQNGSLCQYISSNKPLSILRRWHWALQVTDLIARCHERGVLVFDIALRNFLLADDFSLRIIDFSNSTLVSESTDITSVNEDGCTTSLDLLHLSNVIYSIMTWQIFSIECAMESEWPNIDQMPDLKELDYGQMINKCWNRRFTSIQDLVLEMRVCANTSLSVKSLEQ